MPVRHPLKPGFWGSAKQKCVVGSARIVLNPLRHVLGLGRHIGSGDTKTILRELI
jgi:hypothetical protein